MAEEPSSLQSGGWASRGLWRYLIHRNETRKELAREIERNKLNAHYLENMPCGMNLTDSEDPSGGRTFSLSANQRIVVMFASLGDEVDPQARLKSQARELPRRADSVE